MLVSLIWSEHHNVRFIHRWHVGNLSLAKHFHAAAVVIAGKAA